MNLIKIKELSKILQISSTTIYRLCSEGMPHIRVGSQYRFELDKVISFLHSKIKEKMHE